MNRDRGHRLWMTPSGANDRRGRATPVALLMVLAVLAMFGFAFMLARRHDDQGPIVVDDQRLSTVKFAIAATEDFATEQADQAWQQLLAGEGDSASVSTLQNAALNRILLVDQLTAKTTNATLAAEAKQEARNRLPDVIQGARESIELFSQGVGRTDASSSVNALVAWMNARVDLHEASLLIDSLGRSTRRRIFSRLADDIQSDPDANAILAGTLSDILAQLGGADGLSPEMLGAATAAFVAVSEANSDNLFLALTASQLAVASEKAIAIDSLKRTGVLAQAIAPQLSRQIKQLNESPTAVTDKIVTAIEQADWNTANNELAKWYNVLNPTELVKTDRRLVTPHPLDRLSFEGLRRLASLQSGQSAVKTLDSVVAFDFETISGTEDARHVAAADLDLDLLPEIIVASESVVRVFGRDDDEAWTTMAEASFGDATFGLQGILATDLFMVDRTSPEKLKILPTRVDAEDEQDDSQANEEESVVTTVGTARHEVVPSIVVFGAGGLRFLNADLRSVTEPAKRLTVSTRETGLEDLRDVVAVVPGDLEGDGDLDLVIATQSSGVQVFINRGSRQFFRATELPDLDLVDLAIADLDRDLDLDVVGIERESGRVGLLENLLHLQFRYRPLKDVIALPGATEITVEDFDGNVSWDLLVAGPNGSRLIRSQTSDAGAWTVESTIDLEASFNELSVRDFDNDSMFEIVGWSGESAESVVIEVNLDVAAQTSAIDAVGIHSPVATAIDEDGRLDLVGVNDGGVVVGLNVTETDGHHLKIRIRGIDDNASGRVNHYAIGSVLEAWFGPHYRSRIITDPVTHFGLDGFATADSVRIIFPNGLTQTIRNPPQDALIEEEQTLKGSCPYLYTWDGQQFAFVTDCLWAAPLGLQVASGVVAKDRPWEYLKVDGRFVQPKGGAYELCLTEELWEIAYFDHVALTAVDHPADVTIETNEKVGPPELTQPKVFLFPKRDRKRVVSAVDTRGADCTSQLSAVDGDFVKAFDRRFRQGLCPPHWIDVQFDDSMKPVDQQAGSESPKSVYLLLTGWILPTDTSLNIQIDQNPELSSIEFPSLAIPDASEPSGWRTVIDSIGFPGGKTKTIVVDVTEAIDWGDPRMRVRTSAEIYWDAAELVVADPTVNAESIPLTLLDATVGYRGFSERLKPSPVSPETYDYDNVSLSPRWPPLGGFLTEFGNCRELLTATDDAMVVISGGDEIRLRFAVPDEPVPDGYIRDFVLHCVGWDKDADLNTLAGQAVGPLPFRAMQSYPPVGEDAKIAQKLTRDNPSRLARRQSFRDFWMRSPVDRGPDNRDRESDAFANTPFHSDWQSGW